MTLSIELVDTFSAINNKINKAIARELNIRMRRKTSRAKGIFKAAIPKWVMEQEEVKSLLSGGVPNTLSSLFGLTPGAGSEAANAIASSVASAVEVKFTKISDTLTGGIEFNFQSKSFANLLSLSQGHQFTEMGVDLHWLDWLLTKGDVTVVKGFHYQPSPKGRSRGGTMGVGGSFRVDPGFSGTVDNNFITRAFQGREKELSKILASFLE